MPSQQKSCFFISPIKFLLVCLCLFPIPRILASSNDGSTNPSPSLLGRFWEIGCEFSGVVTRVRRSASPIPEEEEPNFEDPEELFKYLYPLADMKPGEDEGNVEGQRSHQDTHSLSSWLEDLMALWHSECHNHRRNKRSAKRMVPMGGTRGKVERVRSSLTYIHP
ncbi:unnamed protein product [Orchesella dallaii]|uniref:Uncharacterized protein n=1 Tax=Orchesella dallaii TaxID=48710 RepID=A0ABP1Q3R4_9HEXA